MAIVEFTAQEIHFTCCFFGVTKLVDDIVLPHHYCMESSYIAYPAGDRLHVYTNGYVVEMADDPHAHMFQRDMAGLYAALQVLTIGLA
jgi:hypothetical protein